MRKLFIVLISWLFISVYVEADTLNRLYDFESGAPIVAQEVDDEFNQIVNLLNGTSNTKFMLLKNNNATDPVCRMDQLGTGPIVEFKKSGTTKVSIGNTGQIISSVTTGTAPLAVVSTTVNTNLNADLLDGLDSAAFVQSSPIPQQFAIANDGAASNATGTLNPTSRVVQCFCGDVQGCDVTMGESGPPLPFRSVIIIGNSPAPCNFNDSSGVLELNISGSVALATYDTLTVIYDEDRWVEVSRSNN